MKVLFCDNSLRELLNFRGKIISDYARRGVEVLLVAPKTLDQISLEPNIRYLPIALNRSGMNPFQDWKYFVELCRIYRRERPDYVFHYTIKPNIYGTLAARRCGIPSSAMIAGLGYVFYKRTPACWLARKLYRFALRFSDKVLVLNVANRELLLQCNMVTPEKLLHLSGGEGVDLQHFRADHRNEDHRHPVFLMIARLLYDKGYEEYVHTAKALKTEYPKVEFQLLGGTDVSYPRHVSPERVKQDAEAGYIRYLGYQPDVTAYIRKADCIVLPSYNEGLSRVLMEALAMGKPIITTDIPGCRETVEKGKNGFLVPPKNTDALIAAVRKFLTLSQEERLQMEACSRRKAEQEFDIRIVIETYRGITARHFPE